MAEVEAKGFTAEIPRPKARDGRGMILTSGSLLVDMLPTTLCDIPLALFKNVSDSELGGIAARLCLLRENQEYEGILEVLAVAEAIDDLRDSPDVVLSFSSSPADFLVPRDP